MKKNYVKPFEICSIRPPTENFSLTFRLTRNCYWNKCAFCPVYKLGARFSKRSLSDVFADIDTAKTLYDLMRDEGLSSGDVASFASGKLSRVLKRIVPIEAEQPEIPIIPEGDLDPRLAWFLSWFNEKPTLEDNLHHLLTFQQYGAETCFLGDGDSLILKPDFLAQVIEKIRGGFPSIKRFTIYGRTRTAARVRSLDELAGFRKAGLHRVHFGLESGSDRVLSLVNKGVTQKEHIEGGQKTRAAGLSCSVYVMPGLGGQDLSEDHARKTAHALNCIQPDFIRLRSLEIFPMTPLEDLAERGDFTPATETQMAEEIRFWVENLEGPTELLSDSASNLLSINGRLPEDRKRMLAEIDDFLNLPERGKRVYSASSRLQSFMGQYGRLSEDIYQAISPYLNDGSLNLAEMPDNEMDELIMLVRSKLMP